MAENRNSGVLYISWAESCSRSDHTARELGGESHMIYLGWLGSHPATILLKYFGQFWMTIWTLVAKRPHTICVMSPPVVAVLPVYLYCLLSKANFILDCHTGAYLNPRWKKLQWLQHYLGRRALTNIVHNDTLEKIARENGCHTTVVSDVPIVYEHSNEFSNLSSNSVAVVCSFNFDEPIQEIFEAARLAPEIHFYITGNAKKLTDSLLDAKPANVQLTGFISDDAYGSLISNASLVVSLTIADNTMLRGAWEAIYQSTPVVVSDWPCLRKAFKNGAIFVDNKAKDIAGAIRRGLHDPKIREGAELGRQHRLAAWSRTQDVLTKLIETYRK